MPFSLPIAYKQPRSSWPGQLQTISTEIQKPWYSACSDTSLPYHTFPQDCCHPAVDRSASLPLAVSQRSRNSCSRPSSHTLYFGIGCEDGSQRLCIYHRDTCICYKLLWCCFRLLFYWVWVAIAQRHFDCAWIPTQSRRREFWVIGSRLWRVSVGNELPWSRTPALHKPQHYCYRSGGSLGCR